MKTTIESKGKDLFLPIPQEILDQVRFKPGQLIEITVSESMIILSAASKEPKDTHLKKLVTLMHREAMELFENDAAAKMRWMTLPQPSLGGRRPFEMLQSEEDIEAVRLLIGRLEHGFIP
ncbi:antitoxin Xre/MbcA/ParS toxin-binding domain-containing protein [Marinobacter xestospongiae]|uniref:Antitoxin Xre/MbcA/ParS toxin-binding domain-containing protein n=1 Tax=Marinobacter xestospongiae TaxID=994319 RepID=A0ABU3W1G0_9GAMM|nr:antitoxin Xre/MbcA/ParS toxin-binding domain-containing protein [Marinobacter xestospongiae]MDV2080378.1 antitoxin Xre/MbcA/ParS toxin-binding domain-containing protein [Marinobacter xestospongiae]